MTATGTINAIYLGNFSSLDSYEADYVSEHAGNLVGVTRDYTQMKFVAVTYYDKDHNGVVADDEVNRVFTRDNGLQQIRWIGQTIVSGEELSNTQALVPIRIRKGALGNNTPDRDLMVSPNHRVLLLSDIAMMMFDENEILVEAKHLVGLHGIERVAVPSAHYIHLML
ncbi:MAG: hypothetical protein EBU27_01415, partial [Opitutae bacterium]|nr:hypothetical protein [Opitutae bacterium]